MKTFKTFQYNITCIFHINSSNRICTIFGKICYVACPVNRAGKLICLRAYLHERDCTGLIGKPVQNPEILRTRP